MGIFDSPSYLIAIGVCVIVAIILIWVIVRVNKVQQQMIYINSEIERTSGREQRYWRKVKKRMYLSIIPFYGLFYSIPRSRKKSRKHSSHDRD